MFKSVQISRTSISHSVFVLLILSGVLLLWPGLLQNFFSVQGYDPHGECYLWQPNLVSLFVSTDTLIGLSYYAISITLIYFAYRARHDIPFHWVFLAFGGFIIACGTTHFFDVLTVWIPTYWTSGYIRLITALASVTTAIALPPTLPKVFKIIDAARLSDERKLQLEKSNASLELEIVEHRLARQELQKLYEELEIRVQQRTADLQIANEEIGKLNTELEQRVLTRTAQLESTNKELESFSYSVSHDLRAPLRAVNGFAHILVKDYRTELAPEAVEYLDGIQESASQMNLLIESMLNLSRWGRHELVFRPVDVNDLVEVVVSDLRGNSPAKIMIDDLPSCQADSTLLKQVFVNLISNALKFTGSTYEPRIEISSQKSVDGKTVYFVKDNGAGFDMEYAHKLFGVFQRLHSAEEYDGTGVGLAIVQRIIQRHGGRVWAEGAVNQGATFYFTIN